MEEIIVTGGAGFIGYHLCKKLLEEGKQVICIDNLYTGQQAHIDELKENPNFIFVDHDIINPISIPCNKIFHLASPASPPQYQKDPIFTTKTNVIGTLNMLNLAKDQKATFVHASTSEIYGDPEIHPQTENYWGHVNPVGIRSCYDEGKRCAETLCMDYNRQFHVDIKIIRIFNTYGPHMHPDDGRVVSNFITQSLTGKPLTIYGDGKQTRSFQYIDDLIQAISMLAELRGVTGPINIGNPDEVSILELAHKVIDFTNSKNKISFHPLPQDDPIRRCPDISLAKNTLNWEPKTSLDEGLKKTIEYFQSLIKK